MAMVSYMIDTIDMSVLVMKLLINYSIARTSPIYTGCPDTFAPHPQQNWAVTYPKPIHFHGLTSTPD